MNRCPMCDVRVMIGSRFCQSCGFEFPQDDEAEESGEER
jgi:DNA-directed RNA polymerase subunit RPC12/RpoP